MKKRMLVLPFVLLSAEVLAAEGPDTTSYPNHSYGLYMRTDLEKNDSDADVNDEGDALKFTSQYLRLNFTGDITEKTSYRVRFRLDRALDPGSNIDGTGVGVNYAYIDHTLTNDFKVRFGKQYFAGACGREGDYSGADVYRYSLTCNINPFYREGLAILPKYGDQSFVLSVVNSGSEANQSGLGFGATWYGSFLGGLIKPIFTFVALPTTKQVDLTGAVSERSSTNTYIATGVQYAGNNFLIDLDYMIATIEDRSGTSSDENYASTVLNGRLLTHNKFQPVFKLEKSDFDGGGNTGMDREAYTVGVEYFPNQGGAGVDWRTHAVFTSATDSFDNGSSNIDSSKFIVGISFSFTGS
jgi:hypothetical protein